MAIIQRSRKRHSNRAPLEPWQERYLSHDGRELAVEDFRPQWLQYFDFCKLCDGEIPVNRNPLIGRHPAVLWAQYGADYLQAFITQNPGRRPLPWYQREAPGAADPKGRDRVKFFKAQNLARNRARWPHEKQAEFLRTHGLLTKQEERRT